ncbi:MAG TPA: hypothetical protein DCQ51_19300 [Planktothrix sp. UBA8407]|jgi:hypothetical protein|nr:hypothetical protein [Planktothrix sp. UBA8407]HBK21677.1 hypothetical protein [Planktothrix sp. UBA10369]
MLAQLRSRYPAGSLISELLTIYQGKYVVRAIVQVDGVILTTGLAAADTVELAEDQAKKRAIQALGTDTTLPKLSTPSEPLKPAPIELQPEVISPVTAESPIIDNSAFVSPSILSDKTPVFIPSESTSITSDDWLSATYIQPKTEKQKSTSDKDEKSSTSTTSKGRSASLPPIPSTGTTEVVSNYPDEPEFSQPSVSSSRPLETTDFSSDIAKTDIQLKRLRWTQEQGRAHLLKAYGKRSRQHLTDDELLDFLHYLESLSTPIES